MGDLEDSFNKDFDSWLSSLDTSENVMDHLEGQRSFHFKFYKYMCNGFRKD